MVKNSMPFVHRHMKYDHHMQKAIYYLSLSLSFSLFLFAFFSFSLCLQFDVSLAIQLSNSLCMSVCLFVCLSICIFVCLTICLCVRLSVCMSVCLHLQGRRSNSSGSSLKLVGVWRLFWTGRDPPNSLISPKQSNTPSQHHLRSPIHPMIPLSTPFRPRSTTHGFAL